MPLRNLSRLALAFALVTASLALVSCKQEAEQVVDQFIPKFECQVNGNTFTTRAAAWKYEATTNKSYIVSPIKLDNPDFKFVFQGQLTPGTYNLGLSLGQSVQATGFYQMGSLTSLDSTYNFTSGTVTITSVSPRLNGTFTATGVSTSLDTVRITNGKLENLVTF